jgi:hypothetical protein
MKYARSAALTLAMAALPAFGAAQDFEGTVTYRMSMGTMDVDMKQSIKGTKIRQEMDSPMGTIVSIVDTETGKVGMQVPGQPMQVMDLNALQAMSGQAKDAQMEVTATGRTETVAGHECQHYTIKQGPQAVDVCVATGLGFLIGGGNSPGTSLDLDMLKEEFKDGYFPLKLTVDTPQGQMVMEAVSLERPLRAAARRPQASSVSSAASAWRSSDSGRTARCVSRAAGTERRSRRVNRRSTRAVW